MAVPCTNRELKYPIPWADYVIRNLYSKHPRAPEFIDKALGLSRRQLCIILASCNPAWPIIRDMAKTWDEWCKQQRKVRHEDLDPAYMAHILLHGVSRGEHSFRSYLKSRKIALESKSREQREGLFGAAGVEQALPTFPADSGGLHAVAQFQESGSGPGDASAESETSGGSH